MAFVPAVEMRHGGKVGGTAVARVAAEQAKTVVQTRRALQAVKQQARDLVPPYRLPAKARAVKTAAVHRAVDVVLAAYLGSGFGS